MNDIKKFIAQWSEHGYEKGETHDNDIFSFDVSFSFICADEFNFVIIVETVKDIVDVIRRVEESIIGAECGLVITLVTAYHETRATGITRNANITLEVVGDEFVDVTAQIRSALASAH